MSQLALAPPRRIEFVVYGRPAPQGSKKAVGNDRQGRAILVESSKHVAPWRSLVHHAAVQAREGVTLTGPVVVRMVFTLPKPKSAPKTKRTRPSGMPDLSKLCRAVEDALTNAAVWEDDGRVVEYQRLAKVYPGEDHAHQEALDAPGVRIAVWEVRE